MTTKELPSQQYLQECFTYDPETGLLYWKKRPTEHFVHCQNPEGYRNNWNSRFAGKQALSYISDAGYRVGSFNRKQVKAHRVVWKLLKGSDAKYIDHINGDTLDNLIENLRSVDHRENLKNQRKRKTNSSGQMGVFWLKRTSKWAASIYINNVKKHLGYFENLQDAIAVRKAAEVNYEYHVNHGN